MRITLIAVTLACGGLVQAPLSARANECLDRVSHYDDLGHFAFVRAAKDERAHRDPCGDLKKAISWHSKAVRLGRSPQCFVGLPQPAKARAAVREMAAELQLDQNAARTDRCIGH